MHYQVFVSSTYADLRDERSAVFDALFPARIETFSGFNEEKLGYIRRVIDDSDYYIVIVGDQYGSVTKDGISFTEKEYDYAVSMAIPVLSFIRANPDAISAGKTERDWKKASSLEAFIEKVNSGRLVQTWSSAPELSLKVTQSLRHTMKSKPGIGRVRRRLGETAIIAPTG